VTSPFNDLPEVGASGRRLAAAMGCAALVLLAVALELVSGQAANSPEDTRWGPFVPLGWPQPVRVGWWVLIAMAAATHRLLLDERSGSRRRFLAAIAATPFAVFASGVTMGTSWSTWH